MVVDNVNDVPVLVYDDTSVSIENMYLVLCKILLRLFFPIDLFSPLI